MRRMVMALLALLAPLTLAPRDAVAQATKELGIDAGAVFGLGDESSVNVSLPATRARYGWFLTNRPRWSVEPGVGLGYDKVEGEDGIFTYDLELGALYHLRPFVIARADEEEIIARVSAPYVRPFLGFTGFTGGDTDESEFILGAGLGVKVPWRRQLAVRLEANLGYGFDNEAARIGALAGLSFFTR